MNWWAFQRGRPVRVFENLRRRGTGTSWLNICTANFLSPDPADHGACFRPPRSPTGAPPSRQQPPCRRHRVDGRYRDSPQMQARMGLGRLRPKVISADRGFRLATSTAAYFVDCAMQIEVRLDQFADRRREQDGQLLRGLRLPGRETGGARRRSAGEIHLSNRLGRRDPDDNLEVHLPLSTTRTLNWTQTDQPDGLKRPEVQQVSADLGDPGTRDQPAWRFGGRAPYRRNRKEPRLEDREPKGRDARSGVQTRKIFRTNGDLRRRFTSRASCPVPLNVRRRRQRASSEHPDSRDADLTNLRRRLQLFQDKYHKPTDAG